jgi:hypothetical protein
MAPKLALLGPDGSFQKAVTQLTREQSKIIPVFILGELSPFFENFVSIYLYIYKCMYVCVY